MRGIVNGECVRWPILVRQETLSDNLDVLTLPHKFPWAILDATITHILWPEADPDDSVIRVVSALRYHEVSQTS